MSGRAVATQNRELDHVLARKVIHPHRLLLLLGTLVLLLGLCGTGMAIWRLRAVEIRQTEGELVSLNRALSEQAWQAVHSVDLLLLATRDLFQGASAPPLVRADDATPVHQFLRERISAAPQVQVLFAADAEGKIIYSSRGAAGVNVPIADRDYYVVQRDEPDHGLFISAPTRNRFDQKWTFFLSRRINGPQGEFLGIAAASVELNYFESGYQALQLGEGRSIGLLLRNGALVVRYPAAEDLLGLGFQHHVVVTQADGRPDPRIVRGPGIVDTEAHIYSVSTIRDFPLLIYVAVSERAALSEWRADAALLGTAALAGIAVVLGLLAGISREWGKRERAELALRQSEEEVRLVIANALDAVVTMDAATRVVHWNAQAETIFGRSAREALGQKAFDLTIPARNRQAHERGLTEFVRSGEGEFFNRRVEITAMRRDTSEFPIELAITPIRSGGTLLFSCFIRDISERKLAEARLQAQLARIELLNRITRAISERLDLQSLLQVTVRSVEDNLPVDFACVLRYEAEANRLLLVAIGVKNAALAAAFDEAGKSTDVDANNLRTCLQGEVRYETDLAEISTPVALQLTTAGLRSAVAVPLIVGGQAFGIMLAARAQPDGFGIGDREFLRQLGEHAALAAHQARLYGDLQQAYDDLKRTRQAAVQQERLRAFGQMASGIAHDINNAISPASLYVEALLENEHGLSAKATDYLQTIQRAIDDVTRTVARMREFYREREPQLTLEPVDMNQLAVQALDLTQARWRSMSEEQGFSIEAVTHLEAGLPPVMGSESEIRGALTNLIFNSVDAMPQGGRLVLRTRSLPAGAHDAATHVLVEVSDSGVGMDEDTRRRCLEPFFTTKGERGTGLGLAMVYGMVQRHSAEIEIDSAPGQGTTIRCRFPLSRTILDDGAPVAASGGAMPSLRILLVDDDPLLLKSLCDALEHDGHQVTTADSGQKGIDTFAAARQTASYAVVITDLGMPNVDGRSVARGIKQMSATTPVILLTGWGQRMVAEGDIPPHVDRVLGKPPKLKALRETLAEVTKDKAQGKTHAA